ncbi:hypothetical protein U6A24_10135 [Aquimarina gracilis]|uniref:SWIRM domain-containing protein n=1 Tax=Aquimarina gracilis TaxID=874422 RepID=A0ABU5ZUQ7_9FLAO|nr:hypothetical protein [Aquimarina gracilis]MEB3345822.1 hypothetical protein [Aquimarina gracilis]
MENMIERYAIAFKEENYPPIAGKILGLFLISNQEHFTFEELMEGVSASKSATSKALKFLIEKGEVNYNVFKGSKRKRHFHLDIQGGIDRIKRLIDGYKMQNQLWKETLALRNQDNIQLNNFLIDNINFSDEHIQYIDKTIKKYFDKSI